MSIGVAGDKQVEGGFFSEPLPESEDSDATLLNAEVEASFADGDVSPEESSEELKDQEGDGYHFPSCDEASGTRPSHQDGRGGERRILGIRLHGSCMVYRLAASFPGLVTGDRLLVQTKDGEAEGRVMFVSHIAYLGKQDQRKLNPGRITRIIRKIEEISAEQVRENREKEIKAKILGRELVRQAQLPMKLSRVNYQPGGTKAVFYFTSEDRVDFRELVKKLTEELSVRIEMRHVGVRDETRLLGGVGHCGKDFC
ncbi:MAG TPA: hypothetical protein HPQ00_01250, partial [Magnetococcales bacterium]|nr:hypothetical protein [Magnetococcales bacterium]